MFIYINISWVFFFESEAGIIKWYSIVTRFVRMGMQMMVFKEILTSPQGFLSCLLKVNALGIGNIYQEVASVVKMLSGKCSPYICLLTEKTCAVGFGLSGSFQSKANYNYSLELWASALVFMRQPLVSLVPGVVELDDDVFNFSLNFFTFLMCPDTQEMAIICLVSLGVTS